MSDTENEIPYGDNNQMGGKLLAGWERYKPLLEHDYYRAGYILSLDTTKNAHAKVSVLYIYVNYNVILLYSIIIKKISLVLIYTKEHYTSEDHMKIVRGISKLHCHQSEEEIGQTIDQFCIEHETLRSRTGSFKHNKYGQVLPSNMDNHICGTICMQIHSPRSSEQLVAK